MILIKGKSMAKKRAGEPVEKAQTRNPVAVSIVNARAKRDHIHASTATALIIMESQSQRGNDSRGFPGGQANNPQSLSSPRENRPGFLDNVVEK